MNTQTLQELITSIIGSVPQGYEFLIYSFCLVLLLLVVVVAFYFIFSLFSRFLKFK